MSADEQITVQGPHVEIEIVDAQTASLARQYIEAVESVATDEESATDESADAATTGGNSTVAADAPPTRDDADTATDANESDDIPIDDRDWEQYDDRDGRVEAFIAAMYDHYGEPFETTASAVAKQTDDASKGVVWSLKALDGFEAEKAGETDEGATVWRIAPDEPIETELVDEPDTDDDDSDDSEDAESDDDPEADKIPQNHPTIEVEDRTKTRTLDANDVVDALQQPTKHRAKAQLGLSLDAFEDLLAQLDLTERFEADAPLPAGEIQETVATYLEVDA